MSNVVYKCTEAYFIMWWFSFPSFSLEPFQFSSGLLVVLLPGQPGACMVVAVAAAMIDVETKLLGTVSISWSS